jgi:hypothetical protein
MNHDRAQLQALGSTPRDFRSRVHKILMGVEEMLVEKNQAYGDSALNPVRVFSQASPEEQILVRIDDKLSRIARGKATGEDVLRDLQGYLVLLKMVKKPKRATAKTPAKKVKQ